MIAHRWFAVLVAGALLAGCSGGGGGASCDNNGATPLAAGAWPKYRHDNANTGQADAAVNLSGTTVTCRWQFPPDGTGLCGNAVPLPAKGAFGASPTLSADGAKLYIGSNDGLLYAVHTATGVEDLDFTNNLIDDLPAPRQPILSSAAVNTMGDVFVGTNASSMLIMDSTGTILVTAVLLGPVAGSPAFAPAGTRYEGTAYVGSVTNQLTAAAAVRAVCYNGIPRWAIPDEEVDASPAVAPDGTVFMASAATLRPLIRAIDPEFGEVNWLLSAATAVYGSPVLDVVDGLVATIFVVDSAGRLLAINPDGTRRLIHLPSGSPVPFEYLAHASVLASPALDFPGPSGTADTIYIATQDHRLIAVDTATATARAIFQASGSITSSPAVIHADDHTAIIFGDDDGNVYRVDDMGDVLVEVWRFATGSSIGRSSPAIGADGTIYIGAQNGRVYALTDTSPE